MDMNEELKSRLIKYLDYLDAAGKKGADFVVEQAPETVHQFVKWEIFYNLAIAVGCLIAMIVLSIIAYKCIKQLLNNNLSDGGQVGRVIATFICCVVMIGLCENGAESFSKGSKAYIAPNVFLIEKAVELSSTLKGKS